MTSSHVIELWLSAPTPNRRISPNMSAMKGLERSHIYPSGRSALGDALHRLGLTRQNTVALPPYSSSCVNSAVGKVAAPMPLLVDGPHPDAILVYEQWGWPVGALALARLRDAFDGKPIILDSVDVPFPGPVCEAVQPLASPIEPAFRIWSFGKILGTTGGGLLTASGKPISYAAPNGAKDDFIALEAAIKGLSVVTYSDFFRSYSPVPPDDILEILGKKELEAALGAEILARQTNARALSCSDAAEYWRPWMFDALNAKAAPGLAPLFIGESAQELQELSDQWRAHLSIETKVYHFNLSGDPLNPEYLPCLAVPLHSGVTSELLEEGANRKKTRSRARGHALVVGGGIAGIMAARMLADRYNDVSIIETGPEVGGLMRSIDVEGAKFDFGTHVPMTIGHVDIDRMLFYGAKLEDWNLIPRSLREGIFYNGQLDTESGCLDADILSPEQRDQALRELAVASGNGGAKPETLEQRLLQDYGKTLTQKIFTPVLKRLTGCKPAEIMPDVLDTFSLRRVRMFDRETAAILKTSPALDARIAYRATNDGRSDVLKLYPKRNGAQLWLDGLLATAADRGVSVRTGTSISEIDINDGNITSVVLADGMRIDCDFLVWTAPPIAYLKATDTPCPSMPPLFRDMIFVHLIFDAPFPHDLEYMCCYDDGFLTYRVTFYPALRGDCGEPPYTATAEILAPPDAANQLHNDEALVLRIVDELKQMGLTQNTVNVMGSHVKHQRFALPIPTPESAAAFAEQISIARGTANNLRLIGRNNFKHFLGAVLKDTYEQIVCPAPLEAD